MRKIILILAVFSLMTALPMPVMSQGTGDHLQPCDIILPKFEAVYTGNILEDPEGFRNHLESMRNNPRTYDTKCWSIREEPSFEESYEIQCIYNRQSEKFRLELMVQNQQNPHVLDIDEETAYRMQTLIDAAVYSASNLPDKEWMQQKLDNLKSGDGVMASVVGLDGTTYKFFNRRYGAKCWSPGGGNNAALVAIVKAFYNAIGYKDTERISSKLEDIKNLTGKYASQLQDPYREYYLLRIDKKPANWVFDF
jgi:hypothetical protein